jgi:hypothetical protein
MKDEIRQWVYTQIERWAQDNFEASESWAQNQQWVATAEIERKKFIKDKKKEFEELVKNEN